MIKISPVTLADRGDLIRLENELFSCDRISPRQFRYLINRANSIVVKVEQEKTILGYMILLQRSNSSKLRLYSIAVAPWARKLGVAKHLLDHAEQVAVQHHYSVIILEVCENNASATQLYRSAGFIKYGEKPGYYEDGCTALLFVKQIPSS